MGTRTSARPLAQNAQGPIFQNWKISHILSPRSFWDSERDATPWNLKKSSDFLRFLGELCS